MMSPAPRWSKGCAPNCGSVRLKLLSEAAYQAYLSEPKSAMGSGTHLVVDLGVRGELLAALRAPPLLRSRNQSSAHAATANLRHDVPALEICHSVAAAALCTQTNRQFHEANQLPCPILGDENFLRFTRLAGEKEPDLLTVLRFAALRPESAAQLQP